MSVFSRDQHRYSERVLRYPDGMSPISHYLQPTDCSQCFGMRAPHLLPLVACCAGVERRIVYPVSDSEDDTALSLEDPYRSFAEEFQPDRWGPEVRSAACRSLMPLFKAEKPHTWSSMRMHCSACSQRRRVGQDVSGLWSGLFDEATASPATSPTAEGPAVLDPPQQQQVCIRCTCLEATDLAQTSH